MSTEACTLFEANIENPLGLHMDRGLPVAGNTWQVYADVNEGVGTVSLGDTMMSPKTAHELAMALLTAVDKLNLSAAGALADLVGGEIGEIMARTGVEVSTLARACGVPRPRMTQKLACPGRITLPELAMIASVLGVRPAALFGAYDD